LSRDDREESQHPHVAPVRDGAIDTERAQGAVIELLDAIGVDLEAEDLRDTPKRVADMYRELLTPKPFRMTTFENSAGYDELVLVRDIPFVQERLTKQLADMIQSELSPKGVGVVLDAEHQCMTIRGAQASGTKTVTSTMYGLLRDNLASREEFISLSGIGR
jgi:GTP cyclohydrolase IA